jgi:phosphotransferase system HPr (HPr) family protein
MAEREVEVRNPSGLHARPAAAFVKAAGALGCDVKVTNLSRNSEKSASAKSVLGVMGLGISRGHRIRLSADGEGAEDAVTSLVELVQAGLGEELGEA